MQSGGIFCDRCCGAWICLLTLTCGLPLVGGCDGSNQRGVTGVVTLDGKPLDHGNIVFRPQSGTASPSAGAHIVNGEFSIAAKQGLLPGKFCVEITAVRRTDRKRLDHFSGTMVTLEEQFLPGKYNSQTQLEALVGENGPNCFEFTLASEK